MASTNGLAARLSVPDLKLSVGLDTAVDGSGWPMSTSAPSLSEAEADALCASLHFDLDQLFLQWAALDTTHALLADLRRAAAAAGAAGASEAETRVALARVLFTANASKQAAGSPVGTGPGGGGMPAASPRRSLSGPGSGSQGRGKGSPLSPSPSGPFSPGLTAHSSAFLVSSGASNAGAAAAAFGYGGPPPVSPGGAPGLVRSASAGAAIGVSTGFGAGVSGSPPTSPRGVMPIALPAAGTGASAADDAFPLGAAAAAAQTLSPSGTSAGSSGAAGLAIGVTSPIGSLGIAGASSSLGLLSPRRSVGFEAFAAAASAAAANAAAGGSSPVAGGAGTSVAVARTVSAPSTIGGVGAGSPPHTPGKGSMSSGSLLSAWAAEAAGAAPMVSIGLTRASSEGGDGDGSAGLHGGAPAGGSSSALSSASASPGGSPSASPGRTDGGSGGGFRPGSISISTGGGSGGAAGVSLERSGSGGVSSPHATLPPPSPKSSSSPSAAAAAAAAGHGGSAGAHMTGPDGSPLSPGSRAAFIAAANAEAFPMPAAGGAGQGSPGAGAASPPRPGSPRQAGGAAGGSSSAAAGGSPASGSAGAAGGSPSSRGAGAVPTPGAVAREGKEDDAAPTSASARTGSPSAGGAEGKDDSAAAESGAGVSLGRTRSPGGKPASAADDADAGAGVRPRLVLADSDDSGSGGSAGLPGTIPSLSASLSASGGLASASAAAAAGKSQPQPQSLASARLPRFYSPGEGGRGRGRALPGESLEAKLPAIIDTWTRHSAAGAPPPAPQVVRVRRVRVAEAEALRAAAAASGSTTPDVAAAFAAAARLDASADAGFAYIPHTAPAAASGGSAGAAAAAAALQPTAVRVRIAGVEVPWEVAHTSLPVEQFAAVAKQLCGFPSFFAAPLMRRVRAQFAPAALRGPAAGGTASAAAAAVPAAMPIPVPPALFAEEVDEAGRPVATPAGPSASAAADASGRRVVVVPLDVPENAPTAEEAAVRDTSGGIPLPVFLAYWRAEMEPFDHTDRFFRLVRRRLRSTPASAVPHGITPPDLTPFMEELLAFHPGLGFLEATPEFQEKYARTVIARIFYSLDFAGRGVIDARQLRRSNVVQAFHTVDLEDDINAVTAYFSYEHFYVLYCKFWELDADHDFLLSRGDLSRMSELTSVVLDRVFAGAGRPSSCGVPGRMGFEDFVCFHMSEEDKTSEAALRYWFNVCDMDGDGFLSAADMRHFYGELQQRMRNFGTEPIRFEDIFCQMNDLCKPRTEGLIALQDLLHPERIKLAGVFFSCMWSMHKLTLFDSRDPWTVKQELNMGAVSQWDRYAAVEYARLASEEEESAAAAAAAGQAAGGAAHDGGLAGGISDATTASIIGASFTDLGATFGGPGSGTFGLGAGGSGGGGGSNDPNSRSNAGSPAFSLDAAEFDRHDDDHDDDFFGGGAKGGR